MPARKLFFDSRIAERISRSRESPRAQSVSSEDLEGFRRAQTLAFRCAVEVAGELREGWTERRIAKRMDTYLRDHGVKSFFHRSLAWVGDRSRFDGFEQAPVAPELFSFHHFMPTRRAIKPGDVVILDTAPYVDGYPGDIGYTTSLGAHPGLAAAKSALEKIRRELPRWFSSEMSTREIWAAANRFLVDRGFESRHTLYPFSLLGHRLHRTALTNLPGFSTPFSVQALYSFASHSVFPDLLGPFHAGDKLGLWAMEPHLGADGFGAKFEEILVVEPDRVFWLAGEDAAHLESGNDSSTR